MQSAKAISQLCHVCKTPPSTVLKYTPIVSKPGRSQDTNGTAATAIKVISLKTEVYSRAVLVGVLHGCLAAALDALAGVMASKTGLLQQQLGFWPARQGCFSSS